MLDYRHTLLIFSKALNLGHHLRYGFNTDVFVKHTLFIKHSQNGKCTLLLVYVDDMIITGDNEIEKQTLRERLAAQFEMKDFQMLKYFLGIEVAYFIDRASLFLKGNTSLISSKRLVRWVARPLKCQ